MISKYFYIYKTTNLITGRSYIGMHAHTKKELDKKYIGSGSYLQNSIKKYGLENFKCEIIEFNENITQNREREKFWISELNTLYPNGYNMTEGGEGGAYFDPETNKSLSQRVWQSYTPEERQARIQKMKDGLKNLEVLKVISEKSKAFHSSLTPEEKKAFGNKISKGISQEAREAKRKKVTEYNKTHGNMKEKLIESYGKEEGLKRYELYIERQKISSKASLAKRLQSKKITIGRQQKSPFWKDYQKQKSIVQHIKMDYKKGKLKEDEFVNILNEAEILLHSLHEKVKETAHD